MVLNFINLCINVLFIVSSPSRESIHLEIYTFKKLLILALFRIASVSDSSNKSSNDTRLLVISSSILPIVRDIFEAEVNFCRFLLLTSDLRLVVFPLGSSLILDFPFAIYSPMYDSYQ